eukprot:4162219-Amphidinium_carterae.1
MGHGAVLSVSALSAWRSPIAGGRERSVLFDSVAWQESEQHERERERWEREEPSTIVTLAASS